MIMRLIIFLAKLFAIQNKLKYVNKSLTVVFAKRLRERLFFSYKRVLNGFDFRRGSFFLKFI